MNMTSNCDVTNSAHQMKMITFLLTPLSSIAHALFQTDEIMSLIRCCIFIHKSFNSIGIKYSQI